MAVPNRTVSLENLYEFKQKIDETIKYKALYHLGSYDSVDTSNADYDVGTKKTWRINAWEASIETGLESLYANGDFPFEPLANMATPTTRNTIVGNGLSSRFGNDWTVTEDYQIVQKANDDYFRMHLDGCTTIAQAKAWLQSHNVVLEYELASSYAENYLKGQPISQLDQNGENWLRGEYEKRLNLWDGAGAAFTDYGIGFNAYLKPSTVYTISFLEGAFTAFTGSRLLINGTQVVDYGVMSVPPITFQTPSNITEGKANIHFEGDYTSLTKITLHPMVNLGSSASPYQPYDGPVMHAANVKGVLLWENGSPNASFPETTITVADMSDYEYIAVLMKREKGSTYAKQEFKVKKEIGYYAFTCFVDNGNSSLFISNRAFKINSNTSITFFGGYLSNSYNADMNIPVAIYGIK